jgi:general secretion pathway protein N
MIQLHRWALSGVAVGVCGALLLCAPAAWLASGIAQASAGKILLEEPRGTVWSGSAQLVFAGGTGSATAVRLPSSVQWQLTPAWLSQVQGSGLGVRLTLAAECCTAAGQTTQLQTTALHWLQGAPSVAWQLDTAKLSIPAELLAGLGAPWNTLQLAGQLALESHALSGLWSAQQGLTQLAGAAHLDAHAMQTALSTVRPLGSYRLAWSGSAVVLTTLSGDDALQLSGTGELAGKARFTGEAVATAGREAALANLLHIIGQREQGRDGRMKTLLNLGPT